jgi:protein-S-isoprenylcysteine O-methyltransferase Ste14
MTGARRWRNVPVPEWHVAGLLGGGVLHWLRPWSLPIVRPAGLAVGGVLVFVGLVMVGWSVRSVGRQAIAAPTSLVTTGPYRYSRNPQYLGIVLIAAGWVVGWPSVLTLLMFPILVYAYYRLSRTEHRDMVETYGDEYVSYAEQIPLLV